MSLREDIETQRRHLEAGTLQAWFDGTAPELPADVIAGVYSLIAAKRRMVERLADGGQS